MTSFISNCTHFKACAASSRAQEHEIPYSCLLVNDIEKLDKGFHPKDLNCSQYSQVYSSSSSNDSYQEHSWEQGYLLTFLIMPRYLQRMRKTYGNCGVGLRCICHPKECRDKVISMAGSVKAFGNKVLLSILSFNVVLSPS
ncbi:hypothetical protein GH714_015608 [Hevea brasiliensis]|uniref:Uncharacterized protein n=1 Tax=Hevea brasiliensis TaxID=3981 RepID=A0A6A6LH88_HEVBR|nr:hypothetical protein GH714_015608 [Hevea brasiliensis]